MDPAIWSELPFDLLELIASFCDIDSRRALGFKPRKLPPMDLPPFRTNTVIFRYLVETKTLVYFEISGYDDYYWEVKTDMTYNPEDDRWKFGPESTYHTIWGPSHLESDANVFHIGASFQMAGQPEFV
jgi:hypothetical protein